MKYFVCASCGFSKTNLAEWCDLGCGRDYNRMIDITAGLVPFLEEIIALALQHSATEAKRKERERCERTVQLARKKERAEVITEIDKMNRWRFPNDSIAADHDFIDTCDLYKKFNRRMKEVSAALRVGEKEGVKCEPESGECSRCGNTGPNSYICDNKCGCHSPAQGRCEPPYIGAECLKEGQHVCQPNHS